MRECGIDLKEISNQGIMFVVKNVEIDYKAPGRYADNLSISTEITKVKNVSLEFSQDIKKGEQLLVCAKTVLVCIDKEFRPCSIPQALSNSLSR